MKNLKLVALLALIWSGGFLAKTQAQVDVTVNPIGLLFGDLNLGVDVGITPSFSMEATVGYGGGGDDFTNLKYLSIPVNLLGKYYFSPKLGADRFYADLFLRYVSRNYSADDGGTTYAEYTQTRFGLGIGAGYKVVSKGGLVFDIGLGFGRAIVDNTKVESEGDEYEIDWPNIIITGKLGIGYRFGKKSMD